jgi:probable rRNA maturation factor
MTVFIEIAPEFENSTGMPDFKHVAASLFDHQGISIEYDLTIVIDGDERIRKLNNQFLNQDAPTDVLSFPAEHEDPDTGHNYLGDIIISYPQAVQQADAAGHALSAELTLLVIHGLLHLLGYDHDSPEAKADMWFVQDQVLYILGVQINAAELESRSEK